MSIQELGSATTRVGSINTKMPHVLTRFGEQRDREVWRLITGERLPEGLNLRYCGLDGRPLRVELVTDNQPLKLRVIDETDGLPSVGRNLPPRPEDVLFDLNGNRTLVTRDVTL